MNNLFDLVSEPYQWIVFVTLVIVLISVIISIMGTLAVDLTISNVIVVILQLAAAIMITHSLFKFITAPRTIEVQQSFYQITQNTYSNQ